MSTQLENKAATLAQMLAANRLTKMAADQEIGHEDPVDSQAGVGDEQQKEIEDFIGGVSAASPEAENNNTNKVEPMTNGNDLNQTARQALKETGTTVKTAADYRAELAIMMNKMDKRAAMRKQAAEAEANFCTATEVMQKVASLNSKSTQAQLDDASEALLKLATYNPMFSVVRDHILMRKMAAEAEELAAQEGITPEQAAEALDQAVEADPSIAQGIEDEASDEALLELANAESATDELMAGVQQLADNASANLGQEITPDDILQAIDEVEAQAAEMGVPPEALVQAAIEDFEAASDVTQEDLDNADAILEEAAAQGYTPDETLQIAADVLADQDAAEEASTEEASKAEDDKCEDDKCETKEASYHVNPRLAAARRVLRNR